MNHSDKMKWWEERKQEALAVNPYFPRNDTVESGYTPLMTKHETIHPPRYSPLIDGLDSIRCEPNAYDSVIKMVTHHGHGKARLFFVGNGGSAAVASHMAVDWMKNGGFATFGPGDAAQITCLGNDLGFDNIFSMIVERHGQLGDVLFAISSSGMSEDILQACDAARRKMMNIVTLSGFGEGNFLRKRGAVNFYVPSNRYGTVEIVHLAILHSILDEVIDGQKG